MSSYCQQALAMIGLQHLMLTDCQRLTHLPKKLLQPPKPSAPGSVPLPGAHLSTEAVWESRQPTASRIDWLPSLDRIAR